MEPSKNRQENLSAPLLNLHDMWKAAREKLTRGKAISAAQASTWLAPAALYCLQDAPEEFILWARTPEQATQIEQRWGAVLRLTLREMAGEPIALSIAAPPAKARARAKEA